MKGTRFCPYCGREVHPDQSYCPYCGSKLNNNQNQSHVFSSSTGNDYNTLTLVMGILSMVLGGIVWGIVGLFLSGKADKEDMMTKVGKVLCIVGIITWSVGIILFIIYLILYFTVLNGMVRYY